MKKIELLSPAGSLKSMRYAFAYGADAVYAGQPRYSLRVRNNEFREENLQGAIDEAHGLGKKFFLTVNVLAHNNKVKTFLKDLAPIVAMGPDALIMADPGLIMMVREAWPHMPVHLSVQANTVNYAGVKFWQRMGVERVILSRELSLNEVAEIRQECPDIELEVFVHGALCIAYSGRCLLSGYFNHRDPNQGACTNSCRWEYRTYQGEKQEESAVTAREKILPLHGIEEVMPLATAGQQQRHPLADQVYYLEEKENPGALMPIFEDEHGTYIMNSRDLRAIEHVQRLVEIGVDCLKIEGRTKSHYYVARTAQAYRRAIDDALDGRELDLKLVGMLENLANRGYTDGFFQRHHPQEYQNYLEGASTSHRQKFVGEVVAYDAEAGVAEVEVKNHFEVGDRLELITPDGNRDMVVESMVDGKGNALQVAPGHPLTVFMPLPEAAAGHGMLARYY